MDSIQEKYPLSKMLIGCLLLLVLLFLITSFGSTVLMYVSGTAQMNAGVFWISRLLFWLSLLLTWLYAVKVERQPLLLWQEQRRGIGFYLLSGLGIFGALIAGILVIGITLKIAGFKMDSEKMGEMLAIFRANPALMVFTSVTAGVVEELTFRGYLLPRFAILMRSPVAAILVTSLAFGLLHFGYGSVIQVVGPFFIGLIFAIYYWKYRSITTLICFHFLWDLVSLLVKMR